MAKLPSTIYAMLEKKEREQYRIGGPAGLQIEDIYDVFEECGYKRSTANKWLLNWAISGVAMFDYRNKDSNTYVIRFGDFRSTNLQERTMNGKLWLPLNTVKVRIGGKLTEVEV